MQHIVCKAVLLFKHAPVIQQKIDTVEKFFLNWFKVSVFLCLSLFLSPSDTEDPAAVLCLFKTDNDCVMKFTYSEHASGQSVLTALKEPGQSENSSKWVLLPFNRYKLFLFLQFWEHHLRILMAKWSCIEFILRSLFLLLFFCFTGLYTYTYTHTTD